MKSSAYKKGYAKASKQMVSEKQARGRTARNKALGTPKSKKLARNRVNRLLSFKVR